VLYGALAFRLAGFRIGVIPFLDDASLGRLHQTDRGVGLDRVRACDGRQRVPLKLRYSRLSLFDKNLFPFLPGGVAAMLEFTDVPMSWPTLV